MLKEMEFVIWNDMDDGEWYFEDIIKAINLEKKRVGIRRGFYFGEKWVKMNVRSD